MSACRSEASGQMQEGADTAHRFLMDARESVAQLFPAITRDSDTFARLVAATVIAAATAEQTAALRRAEYQLGSAIDGIAAALRSSP